MSMEVRGPVVTRIYELAPAAPRRPPGNTGRVVTCVSERCQDSDVVWVRTPGGNDAASAEEVIGEASPARPGRWRPGRIGRRVLAGAAIITVALVGDSPGHRCAYARSGPSRAGCRTTYGRRGSLRRADRGAPSARDDGDGRRDLLLDGRAGAAHASGRLSVAARVIPATRRNGPACRSFDRPPMGICRCGRRRTDRFVLRPGHPGAVVGRTTAQPRQLGRRAWRRDLARHRRRRLRAATRRHCSGARVPRLARRRVRRRRTRSRPTPCRDHLDAGPAAPHHAIRHDPDVSPSSPPAGHRSRSWMVRVWVAGFGPTRHVFRLDPDARNANPPLEVDHVVGAGATISPGQHVVWVSYAAGVSCLDAQTGATMARWPGLSGPIAARRGILYSMGTSGLAQHVIPRGCRG